MSRSKDLEERHQAEWEKNRFKHYSREELFDIEARDKERKKAQAEINRIVANAVAKGQAYDENKIKELEQERLKKMEKYKKYYDWKA